MSPSHQCGTPRKTEPLHVPLHGAKAETVGQQSQVSSCRAPPATANLLLAVTGQGISIFAPRGQRLQLAPRLLFGDIGNCKQHESKLCAQMHGIARELFHLRRQEIQIVQHLGHLRLWENGRVSKHSPAKSTQMLLGSCQTPSCLILMSAQRKD